MKRSEVVERLLSAYYFQEGNRADIKITSKTRKMIALFKGQELRAEEYMKKRAEEAVQK